MNCGDEKRGGEDPQQRVGGNCQLGTGKLEKNDPGHIRDLLSSSTPVSPSVSDLVRPGSTLYYFNNKSYDYSNIKT